MQKLFDNFGQIFHLHLPMKPFNSGTVIAAWLLRLMLVWFIYENYYSIFTSFEFKDFSFYIASAYMLFGFLILAGGFMQKPSMTVVSGLAIFILPIVLLIRDFPEEPLQVLLIYLIPMAAGFFFFTHGNNN
jgi:hypothetical protein